MEDKMKEALKDVSLNYGEKAAEVSENKIDDAFMPTFNSLKPIALAMADQIYKGDV